MTTSSASYSLKTRAAAVLELRQRGSLAPPAAPTFRGAALAAQSITAPAWLLAGPAETGKTFAGLWRLDRELSTTPRATAALVRKVRTTIGPTVLRTYERVLARSQSGARPYGGQNPEWYDYPNGARLYIGGMDDPGKVLSGERDFVFVNQAEELILNDWETLATRTTGRGAVTRTPMLFGDCNPGPADHWIKKRQEAGALRLLESRHVDNPTLYDDAGNLTPQGQRSIAVLHGLTGIRRLRLYLGLWVGAEGQYFEQWNPAQHVIAPFPVPLDWPVWISLDHGFAHNTAVGVFTRHDGTAYLLGEHVQHKWLVPQHAAAIGNLLASLGIIRSRISYAVAGHDVFVQRGDTSGMTIAEQYAASPLGLRLRPATIDRIPGAQAMLSALGNPAAGLPVRLKVFASCARTIATIPALAHDPNRPEDVKKIDADHDGTGGDDCYDMLRYGLMSADAGGWTEQDLRALASRRR
jgi:hypothetical protein